MPYPALPAARVAYDVDGSFAFVIKADGTHVALTTPEARNLNDEAKAVSAFATPVANTQRVVLGTVFSAPRNFRGYHMGVTGGSASVAAFEMAVSKDTTTGLDGTWTTIVDPFSFTNGTGDWRAVNSVAAAASVDGVLGVRFRLSRNSGASANLEFYWLHVYATRVAGSKDTLDLWDPTLDQPLTNVDFGDVPQGSVETRQFRVKNLSASLTANNVTVAQNVLTDTTPALGTQYALSTDNITFAATAAAGSLAPGAVSPVLYLRRMTAQNQAIGAHAFRLTLAPDSWT